MAAAALSGRLTLAPLWPRQRRRPRQGGSTLGAAREPCGARTSQPPGAEGAQARRSLVERASQGQRAGAGARGSRASRAPPPPPRKRGAALAPKERNQLVGAAAKQCLKAAGSARRVIAGHPGRELGAEAAPARPAKSSKKARSSLTSRSKLAASSKKRAAQSSWRAFRGRSTRAGKPRLALAPSRGRELKGGQPRQAREPLEQQPRLRERSG